ncbi:MAG: hypothetical protein E7641_02045 [Ruminococcaceae bacterium]|nr:hypothetical protein [Oscillospiraceae bacterium]
MEGRKKLTEGKDRPKLKGEKVEHSEHTKKRKLNFWYRLYLTTTLSVVILTVAFLCVTLSETKGDHGFSAAERLAALILKSSFGDLSGGSFSDKNDTNSSQEEFFPLPDGILIPSDDPNDTDSVIVPDTNTTEAPKDSIYAFDYSKVPEGEKGIIPMDLSLTEYGNTYIHNTTGHSPDTKKLLEADLSYGNTPITISATVKPLVLVLHTHGTESYSPKGALSYSEDSSDYARSRDTSENVVSVGAILAGVLNKQGIPTLHCTIMHDAVQYKDSYARAEQTIKEYLEKYPSIKLVIDLHRDAIVKSSGDLVRPVTEVDSLPTAQVMCVVGSDWGGESCPNWEGNLSLALKLRSALNQKYNNLCRPTYLRPSTYNQELAPFSLLLEIGASGNDLDEAKRAAVLVGYELAPLINSI